MDRGSGALSPPLYTGSRALCERGAHSRYNRRALSDDVDSRAEERVGTVLNEKWALERLLGVGGMAAVYAARHRNGARAAVKVLHADLSRHAEVRERFLREGYAANRVEHPGAVKVLDDDVVTAGPDSGTAYLVMELLEGESLQDRLERGPLVGEREFLAIAEQVLDVLEVAHAQGVVHRDLKPENLFLLREDAAEVSRARVKVLDFGLARLLQGQAITSYGLALGTPSFMSPEQAAGRIDEIDGRTDLFALAATGFRLRTGRRIHEGANAVELVTKMANVAAPRIAAVAPDVSAPFARVIDRALEFRREDRYEDAAAMKDDVRRALLELDAGAAATLVAVPSGRAAEAPPAEPTIEISAGDLERTRVRPGPPVEQAGRPAPQQPAWPEESIRIPRHRSVLPWIVLALLGAGAGKWWLAARARSAALAGGPATTAAPASPVDLGSTRGDAAVDAGAAARSAVASTGSGTAAHPSATASVAGAPRRPTPADVGPGNVHSLPGTHHARSKSTTR